MVKQPSKSLEQAWRDFAAEVGGVFEEPRFSDDPIRVSIPGGKCEVVLDHTTGGKALFTRMAAKFASLDGFWFQLRPRRLLSNLGVWFGMPDMKAGDARIDEQFVVEGNHDGKLRILLANPQIRFLIDAHPTLNFGIDDSIPRRAGSPEIAEVFVELPGLVTDPLVLGDMLRLVREALAAVEAAGSAGGTA